MVVTVSFWRGSMCDAASLLFRPGHVRQGSRVVLKFYKSEEHNVFVLHGHMEYFVPLWVICCPFGHRLNLQHVRPGCLLQGLDLSNDLRESYFLP